MGEKISWDANILLKFFPKEISNYFSFEAELLFNDLKQNKLEVVLIPAPEPQFIEHKIRSAVHQNPIWYKNLYNRYSFNLEYKNKKTKRNRKVFNSKIKRKPSENSLGRISLKKDMPHCFHDFVYKDLIFHRLYYGEDYSGSKISPEKMIVEYFQNGKLLEIPNQEREIVFERNLPDWLQPPEEECPF
jgi:hypothetical protein